MCGRYQFYDNKNPVIFNIIEKAKEKYETLEIPLGEVFPGNLGIVLVRSKEEMEPKIMCWGFPNPKHHGIIINARYEGIRDYFFREDYQKRRCVVPVSGFYEWDADKKKHYISSDTEKPLYLAAVYRNVNDTDYYCILTKEASERLKTIHHRQPILLDEAQAKRYLSINAN